MMASNTAEAVPTKFIQPGRSNLPGAAEGYAILSSMLPLIVAVSVALSWAAAAGYSAMSNLVAIDERVSLGPGEVRAFNLSLRQHPAVVEASFEVVRGGEITVMLMGRGRGRRFYRAVSDRSAGSFRQAVPELGDYQVVLDNRGSQSRRVTAQLRVTLDFDAPGLTEPETLGPVKRAMVVGASLLFLGLAVLWGGRRLWPAIERRRRDERLPLY